MPSLTQYMLHQPQSVTILEVQHLASIYIQLLICNYYTI